MTKIKAPYNFVPLADKVVYPSWEKAVNHDVPFSDGESGTINVKIKTHSPIFVRDGGKGKEGKADEFFESNGNYYIPGSSLKGMLRSVVEVMSFSKMQNANVNDDKYSVRDFQNKDIYPLLDLAKEVKGAWLSKDGGKYYINDCGAPGRIPHHWIDDAFGTKFRSFYKKGGGFNGNKEEHKSAKFKYEQFGNNERTTGFVPAKYGQDNSVDVRSFFKVDPYSNKKATIVFTGQAGPRNEQEGKKPSGKIHEFIFFENNSEKFEVSEETIKNFFFAYFNHDRNRQSVDWKYWKKKLDNNEQIPVFFRYKNKIKQTIKDIGLSYLYKIIYKKSVLDAIPESHKTKNRDFTETLFGYINNVESLKGRVHIGHAKAINDVIPLKAETSVLSGPKASYYPNYIRQSGKNGVAGKYKTFMDDTAVIAGWKRYPVHKNGVSSNTGSTDNKKVETSFVPLGAGVEFEFKIRVHNLRKAELGAILSAVSFHNTPGTFHSIGMAKPLGYGKSSLGITSLEGFNDSKEQYLKSFEAYMNYALGKKTPSWNSSNQIVELLTMVSEHTNSGKSELAYMKMNPKARENDFIDAKNRRTGGGDYLEDYSSLVENVITANSLITRDEILECSKREEELKNTFLRVDLDKQVNSIKDNLLRVTIKSVEHRLEDLIKEIDDVASTLNEECEKVDDKIKKEIDRPYTEKIAIADELFKNKNWQEAKGKYLEAIELKEEYYPKQQKNICNKELSKGGLSLNALSELVEFNSESRKIIQDYFNANKANISENDITVVREFVFRCADNLSGKRLKKFLNLKKDPWKFIKNIGIDADNIQQWFIEITNK